jgi:hypothetical protein
VEDRTVAIERQHLPDRRHAESFEFAVGGLRYTATVGRYPDGSIGELFLIRRALCRDGRGNASGPLGAALDLLRGGGQ